MGHWRTKELTICITDSCNLACTYCYPGDYKEARRTISREFVYDAMDFFIRDEQGPCGRLDRIRFYALGEPTIEFDLIREFHDYAISISPHALTFEIQTNGVFPQNVAQWLADHMDAIWLSLDGPSDIHDQQRPFPDGSPSSPVILRNLKILQGCRAKVGIRPTITKASLNRMREILDFGLSLGVDALYYHHAIEAQGKTRRSREESIYAVPLIEFARRYLEDVVPYVPRNTIFVGNFLTVNFDERCSIYCRSCLPCPQLTVDGFISACDKAPTGAAPRFSAMIFGRWDANQRKVELFSLF